MNMEQKSLKKTPNRIELSEFGHQYLQKLPMQIEDLNRQTHSQQQNSTLCPFILQRKGKTLDFRTFASQTQHFLKRQAYSLKKLNTVQGIGKESKRKLQLHHDHWLSEQKLISHKLADTQARLQQNKYSEYDWRSVSTFLKNSAHSILSEWNESSESRNTRTKAKLKCLLNRKYPGRSLL